jgi:hypothetical protein
MGEGRTDKRPGTHPFTGRKGGGARLVDELQFLRIYDFSGGLNDWGSSYALADNEAQESLNCRLDELAMLQKREGRSVVASTSLPAAACDGAVRVYGNSAGGAAAGSLHVKAGTTLYVINVDDGTTTDQLTALATSWGEAYVLTAGQRMRAAQWGDDRTYLALGTGTVHDEALVTGLTGVPRSLHKMGAKAPTNEPHSAISANAGVTTANEFYNVATTITYGTLGGWGESIPLRDPTAHDQGANADKKVTISSYNDLRDAGAEDWQTKYGAYSMKFYSTEPQGTAALAQAAPLYYVGFQLATSVATTHDFEDADIDITLPAPTVYDTGDIPKDDLDFVCVHNARLYINSPSKPDRVYYSNLNVPDEYPTQNYFDVGGSVTGIASATFGLVVFTKNSITIWRGWGAGDFQQDDIKGIQGCVAPDSVARIQVHGKQVIAYAGEDGIYAFDGYTSEYLGATPRGTGMKVGGTWKNYATKSTARAVAYKHYYLLSYQDSRDSGSYNNRVLAYDTRYDCWWLWDGWDVGAWAHFHGAVDDDELYYGESSTAAGIYEALTGVDNCTWLWVSRDHPAAGPEVSVQAKKCWVEIEEDSLPINVIVRMDGVDKADAFTLPSQEKDTWDNVTWDNFTWERAGTDTVSIGKPLEDSLIGKRCAVKLEQTDAENKKVIGVSVGYYIRGRL